jgi:hypothetical protein
MPDVLGVDPGYYLFFLSASRFQEFEDVFM